MSQLLKDQALVDAGNGIRFLEETLSDGSKVYNLLLDETIAMFDLF